VGSDEGDLDSIDCVYSGVGSCEGPAVSTVGLSVGAFEKDTDGVDEGLNDVGGTVGAIVGGTVGAIVGGAVGAIVGGTVGAIVGGTVGAIVGGTVGAIVGGAVGAIVGGAVGAIVGGTVGAFVGFDVGGDDGAKDGFTVLIFGFFEGAREGNAVGSCVG
jgi:hypothetical protein